MRLARVVAVLVAALAVGTGMPDAWVSTASARPWCHGPGFAYGNAGYAAGYSMQVGRWAGCRPWGWGGGWTGGWGGPGWGWRSYQVYRPFCRPPVWGRPGCWGRAGWGVGNPWFGNPSFWNPWFGGWYGAAAYPNWGYPTTWLPGCYANPCGDVLCAPYGTMLPSGIAPQFGPAGVLPYLGVSASPVVPSVAGVANAPRGVIAARPPIVGRPLASRVSNAAARLRAARLVAIGDRHLRGSGGDPARLNEALDAYRRAAAIAQDQPDTFVRQAITLVALDRRDLADNAIERAVALDGRLGDEVRGAEAATVSTDDTFDPVFDGRSAGGPSVLAVRGTAILREIGGREAEAADAGRSIALLAARWSDRWANGLHAVAANAAR